MKQLTEYGHVQRMADNRWSVLTECGVDATRKEYRKSETLIKSIQDEQEVDRAERRLEVAS